LDEQPASATRGRICALLGEMYINTAIANIATLDDIDVERELKGQQYLLEALQHDWPIDEKLKLTDRLVYSMERTVRRGNVADRRQIGAAILSALNAAQIAGVPDEPDQQTVSYIVRDLEGRTVDVVYGEGGMAIGDAGVPPDGGLPRTPEYEAARKRLVDTYKKNHAERANLAKITAERRKVRIAAVRPKKNLEYLLYATYSPDPSSLDELEELGRALVEDQAYFDRLYAQALEYALDPSKLNDR
jgi:hypothetical protein